MLVYEMVAGTPPFHQEDRVAMFRAICAGQYHMPAHFSPVKPAARRPLRVLPPSLPRRACPGFSPLYAFVSVRLNPPPPTPPPHTHLPLLWPAAQALQDLVKRLLVRVPGRRLGCTQGGVSEVKRHAWFAGFDWDALAARKMRAPFVPRVAGADDASNFDGAGAGPPPRRDSRYQSTGLFKEF